MELFDLTAIPQFIMQYFGPTEFASKEALVEWYIRLQSISLCVAAGLYLICLVMGGLGMMTMAKKVGMKHSWMGFVPFLNTYYAGKLAGETRVFNQKMKRCGLYAMLAEIAYVAVNVFSLVLWFALMNPVYYATVEQSDGSLIARFDQTLMPLNLRWAVTADLVCEIVGYLLYFVLIFFMCVLFFAFFRKYYARGPFLMTFLCAVLPLRGFVIFAVRNNTPVDYDAWMRRRMQEYARQQQQMYGQGGYGGGPSHGEPPAEDPFPDHKTNDGGAKPSGTDAPSDGSDDNPFPDF